MFPKNIAFNYVYQLNKFRGLIIHNLKVISKKGSCLSANANHDVTDFKFHGCGEIKKTEFLKDGT